MVQHFNFSQIPLSIVLRSDTTFDNFVTQNNNMVVDFLKQSIISFNDKTQQERFIYLWGQEGSGKTHLLQACCHAVGQEQKSAFYLSLENLQDYVPTMLQGLESVDLICLDDLHFLSDKPDWQEGLFHLYNRCLNTNTRLIFADRKSASDLNLTLADLKSRLSSVLSFEIYELSDEEKLKILVKRAKEQGMILSEEVSMFVWRRSNRSMKHLLEILNKLACASLSAKHKLTIPFVKAVLNI
ncbi:MAG: DnaA regulatory inactivator Hda [Gammaproteobacteria bacterium]